MTITEFLLARVAEAEAAAIQQNRINTWHEPFTTDRLLAECEAKRAILALREKIPARKDRSLGWRLLGPTIAAPLDESIKALAAVYDDHPDYDETWRGNA